MIEFDDPYTKRPLIQALERVQNDITQFFGTLPADIFFYHPGDGWSPAEVLQHLTKSVMPLALGMKMPRSVLGLLFGKYHKVSRRMDEISKIYADKLAAGAESPWIFRPSSRKDAPAEEPEQPRLQVLKKWEKAAERLLTVLKQWDEQDLDRYRLPHPILGRLTIREMMLFTLYHNAYHVKSVKQKLEQYVETVT